MHAYGIDHREIKTLDPGHGFPDQVKGRERAEARRSVSAEAAEPCEAELAAEAERQRDIETAWSEHDRQRRRTKERQVEAMWRQHAEGGR